MKRSLLVNLMASCVALIVVAALGLSLRMNIGVLLYVLTGAVMVAVLVLVAKDCLYRCFYARKTMTWQYWMGVVLILGTLALFMAASVARTVLVMGLLLFATVGAGAGSWCWMKFCWLRSLEPEINQEGEQECVEETVDENQESLPEDQEILSDEL